MLPPPPNDGTNHRTPPAKPGGYVSFYWLVTADYSRFSLFVSIYVVMK